MLLPVSGVIPSTSRTIARRSFASSMRMNAFTKSKPSDVARKSLTYDGRGSFSRPLSRLRDAGRGGRALEEKWNRHLKDLGEVLQAAGADPIGPLLVFLDLLESQPEGVRHVGLAHIEHETPHAHATTDMLVDRIERALTHL